MSELSNERALSILEERIVFGKKEYSGVAADYIAALQIAAAALRDRIAGGWISVEDRLPETDIDVLVRYIGINSNMVFHQVLHYYACDETPHFQHMLNEKNLKVTHWRPLPAPPSEEGERKE